MQETHDDVIKVKNLPRVGQLVRSRKYGTIWRVIEKREVYQNIADDIKTGRPRMVPAVHLTYRRCNVEKQPEMDKKMAYAYTLYDSTFKVNWEIVDEEKSLTELAGHEKLIFNKEVFETTSIR